MAFDKARMIRNIDLLKYWLYHQHVTIFNPFTEGDSCLRHIILSDDDIALKLADNSKSYVELACTGSSNVYIYHEKMFCSVVIDKTLLEKLDVFSTDFFEVKSNRETFYNHNIYFNLKDCGVATLDNI